MTELIATRIDGRWRVKCTLTGILAPTECDSEGRAEEMAAMCNVLFAIGAKPRCRGCGGTGHEDAHDGPAPCRHCDGTGGPE